MKKRQVFALVILSLLIIVSAYFTYFSLTGKAVTTQATGTTKTYIYAGTLAASKSSEKPTETQYYIQDHLGSNRKVLENGVVEQADDTYAFGETKLSTGTQENNYKFTGKPLDDETGLYYYGARYYSPELGRFIQADTLKGSIENPLELNRYAYVANNPLKYVDPTGKKFKSITDQFYAVFGNQFNQQIEEFVNNPQNSVYWGKDYSKDPKITQIFIRKEITAYPQAGAAYFPVGDSLQINANLGFEQKGINIQMTLLGKLLLIHELTHKTDYSDTNRFGLVRKAAEYANNNRRLPILTIGEWKQYFNENIKLEKNAGANNKKALDKLLLDKKITKAEYDTNMNIIKESEKSQVDALENCIKDIEDFQKANNLKDEQPLDLQNP